MSFEDEINSAFRKGMEKYQKSINGIRAKALILSDEDKDKINSTKESEEITI